MHGNQTLNEQIRNILRAMRRARDRMDEIEADFEFPRDCCPMCACGPEWNELADKRERQAWWLAQLYRKRGGEGDLARALHWERECYKGEAPKVYRKPEKRDTLNTWRQR